MKFTAAACLITVVQYTITIFAKLLHKFRLDRRRERFDMKVANGGMVPGIFKRDVHEYP